MIDNKIQDAYQLGWNDGYAEGYGAKLVDVTELFMPSKDSCDVEAAARYLMSKRADLTLVDAIGLARGTIRSALPGQNKVPPSRQK